MGRLFVPNPMVNWLKGQGDKFEFFVRLRTSDNNNRVYSKGIDISHLILPCSDHGRAFRDLSARWLPPFHHEAGFVRQPFEERTVQQKFFRPKKCLEELQKWMQE